MAYPEIERKGDACEQPVSLLDIFPTLNELCGIPLAEELDGRSLVPQIVNPELKTGRAIVTTQGFRNHAVRSDRWRYILYADGSEELYDQFNDQNFYNLADQEIHASVKKGWPPGATNAEERQRSTVREP